MRERGYVDAAQSGQAKQGHAAQAREITSSSRCSPMFNGNRQETNTKLFYEAPKTFASLPWGGDEDKAWAHHMLSTASSR